ncbi:hypothetical protein HYV88_01735 [Candidatus Woesearchaeota archaeon]|nr:hypothetical protein [Candidatus Woesearchaeota archaeon]
MELDELLLKTAGFDLYSVHPDRPHDGYESLGRKGFKDGFRFSPSAEVGSRYVEQLQGFPSYDTNVLISTPLVINSRKRELVKQGRKGFLGFFKRDPVYREVRVELRPKANEVLANGNEEPAFVMMNRTYSLATKTGRVADCHFAITSPESIHRELVKAAEDNSLFLKRLYERVFPEIVHKNMYVVSPETRVVRMNF